MYYRIIYSISLYICCIAFSAAQDLTVQFRNFTEKVEQAQSIYFKSSIIIEYVNEKPVRQEIQYERTPEKIYYKTSNMEMIINREVSLMIYPENKTVLYQKSDKTSGDNIGNSILLSDTLLQKNDSIIYKGIIEQAHTYIIYSGKKYIKETLLSFRVSDGLLKQAVYTYNTTFKLGVEKATLTFVDFSVNGSATIKIESNTVLTYGNKKYNLTPAYAGYRLINLDAKY